MDLLVVGFVALQAVLLGVAVLLALSRARTIDQVREIAGAEPTADPLGAARRLAERAVAGEWEAGQQRRDLGQLTDLLSIGVLRLDDDLRVDLANTAAHVFLDRQAGSMLGRTAIEAFVDDRIEAIVLAARERGSASGEIDLRTANGGRLAVRVRRSEVRGLWVVLEDVSELRRLQQIRAEFIDNLSHEIRTPLTNLALLAETLTREADAPEVAMTDRMRDRIGKIELETGHLIQMVTELLDLSRIEAGGSFVPLDDVALDRVAAGAVERLRLFAERQSVRLRVVIPDGPPPPVRGDEERLGQVLVNLLHNAVKFSPDGGDVTVRVQPQGDMVVTAVEDHGIGIPRADVARVFERFYKVDRARVRGGGTGLGLAIVRHIVEQHGGRISVESEEGSGSSFRFEIPVANRAGEPPPERRPTGHRARPIRVQESPGEVAGPAGPAS